MKTKTHSGAMRRTSRTLISVASLLIALLFGTAIAQARRSQPHVAQGFTDDDLKLNELRREVERYLQNDCMTDIEKICSDESIKCVRSQRAPFL